MRPEAAPTTAGATHASARQAYARWCALGALYERLDGYVSAGAWADAAALLPELVAMADGLGAAVVARRAAAATAAEGEWAEVDAVAASVVERHGRALRAAAAARDAVATELAHVHASRRDAARYRRPSVSEAFFASRVV